MLLATDENAWWRRMAYWALGVLVLSYVWYAWREFPHGGSPLGLLYGSLGFLIILVLTYFGIRKRSYLSPTRRLLIALGLIKHPHPSIRSKAAKTDGPPPRAARDDRNTVQSWLHAHIYLGLLVLVVILFHSGFRFHDKVAVTALILLIIVVLSGLVGAIIYTMVPPLFVTVQSSISADKIVEDMHKVAERMADIASGKSQEFQKIHEELVHTERPGPAAGWKIMSRSFIKKRAEEMSSASVEDYINRIPGDEHAELTRLYMLGHELKGLNNQLIQKQRYVNIMAAWLYVHVPLTFAMLVAVAVHITGFLYYW